MLLPVQQLTTCRDLKRDRRSIADNINSFWKTLTSQSAFSFRRENMKQPWEHGLIFHAKISAVWLLNRDRRNGSSLHHDHLDWPMPSDVPWYTYDTLKDEVKQIPESCQKYLRLCNVTLTTINRHADLYISINKMIHWQSPQVLWIGCQCLLILQIFLACLVLVPSISLPTDFEGHYHLVRSNLKICSREILFPHYICLLQVIGSLMEVFIIFESLSIDQCRTNMGYSYSGNPREVRSHTDVPSLSHELEYVWQPRIATWVGKQSLARDSIWKMLWIANCCSARKHICSRRVLQMITYEVAGC